MNKLTKDQAIKLGESKFWEGMSDRDIVGFQLFEDLLCMPFSVFHGAVERVLGRPVYTHEFGLNANGLKSEFLGTRPAPSFKEIIDLIPKEKLILIEAPSR